LLSSIDGMACRFHEDDARSLGRATRGVRGMDLRNPDGQLVSEVVAMTVVDPLADLLVVTVKGMGKRTHLGTGNAEADKAIGGGYRLTRRGGKGVISIRLREGDRVVAALQVLPGDEMLISSVKGQMVRIGVDDIRPIGRNSYGVRVMRLREGDELSSVSLVDAAEADANGRGNGEVPSERMPTALSGAANGEPLTDEDLPADEPEADDAELAEDTATGPDGEEVDDDAAGDDQETAG
jgi:DNA gyrase subunit A